MLGVGPSPKESGRWRRLEDTALSCSGEMGCRAGNVATEEEDDGRRPVAATRAGVSGTHSPLPEQLCGQPPAPASVRTTSHVAPAIPAMQTHDPPAQKPRPEQLCAHPMLGINSSHESPRKPGWQLQVPSLRHIPWPEQLLGHDRRTALPQSRPSKPGSQMHCLPSHLPWPAQFDGHAASTLSQASPVKPRSHRQRPVAVHRPCPEQKFEHRRGVSLWETAASRSGSTGIYDGRDGAALYPHEVCRS